MRKERTHDDIGPDEPVRLSDACRIFFGGALGPAALRTENRKGNLVLERIAGKDFVTGNAIKAMREKCQILGNRTEVPQQLQPFVGDQEMSAQEALGLKLERLQCERQAMPREQGKGWRHR